KRETRGEAPARVELQKLVGHVPHGSLDRSLAARPAGPPEAIERRLRSLDTGILLDEIEALDRKKKRFFLRVTDLHELAWLVLDRNALQALEKSDPVVAMHDGVAELQVSQVGEKRLRRASARRPRFLLFAEDLAFRVDGDGRLPQTEARRDLRRDGDHRSLAPLRGNVEPVFQSEAFQLFGPAGRGNRNEDLRAG